MRRRLPTTACTLALLLGAPAADAEESPSRSPVVVEVSDDGFDWADAAIGAAAATGVWLAGAGVLPAGRKPDRNRREP
jgi:hypothetical protein